MRRELALLQDIVESCDELGEFIAGMSISGFVANKLVRAAVVQKLMVIGEAAARLPVSFREAHADVEWRDIVGLRNILIHAYFRIDWNIVWVAATTEIPPLRQQIAQMLANESPRS